MVKEEAEAGWAPLLKDLELSNEVARVERLGTLVRWFLAAMTWSAAMISARLSRGMMFTSACKQQRIYCQILSFNPQNRAVRRQGPGTVAVGVLKLQISR